MNISYTVKGKVVVSPDNGMIEIEVAGTDLNEVLQGVIEAQEQVFQNEKAKQIVIAPKIQLRKIRGDQS